MWDVRTVPFLLPGSSDTECLAEDTVWIRHVMYLWSVLTSWAFSRFGSALLLPAAGPLISHVLDPKPEAPRQQLSINLFLFYLYFILRSLFPLPDTPSGCWQRVVIPGKKHRHSTLFQTPSPTLEDIRGHEMSTADTFGPLNYHDFASHIIHPHFFFSRFLLREVEGTWSRL